MLCSQTDYETIGIIKLVPFLRVNYWKKGIEFSCLLNAQNVISVVDPLFVSNQQSGLSCVLSCA